MKKTLDDFIKNHENEYKSLFSLQLVYNYYLKTGKIPKFKEYNNYLDLIKDFEAPSDFDNLEKLEYILSNYNILADHISDNYVYIFEK